MQVETYEVAELDRHPEVCAESERICSALGLKQQSELRQRGGALAFRPMTRQEQVVFRALCPESTPLDKYALEALPLRVLQVAELGRPHFHTLIVWHPQVVTTDPVLVGVRKVPNQFGRDVDQLYLLARWGEALESWPTVLQQMTKKIKAELLRDLARIRGELEGQIEAVRLLDEQSIEHVSGKPLLIPALR